MDKHYLVTPINGKSEFKQKIIISSINPLLPSAAYMRRNAKILILF